MAATVTAWVAKGLIELGVGAGAAKVVAGVVVDIGVAVAANAAASALMGGADASSDNAKGTLKQAIPPRVKAYGRGELGGYFLLWEAKDGVAYEVAYFQQGRAQTIEEIRTHQEPIIVGPDGWVEGNPRYGGGDGDLIRVGTRLGVVPETPYAFLTADLAADDIWTEDHRGDGMVTLGARYATGKQANLLDDYPFRDQRWTMVGEWTPIWDPRDPAQSREDDSNWTASGNLAMQIMAVLTDPDLMAEDYETTVAPVLEHWKGEMDICDEAIPQKAGDTAPRYHAFAWHRLPEDPQVLLDKLLAACDGKLLMDADGCWKLWVGKTRMPTVWLTEDDIIDFDVAGDATPEDVVNEIVPSFRSEAHKWTMVETQPWRNTADADLRGRVETMPLPLEASTNNSQTMRVAKRLSARMLSPLRGQFRTRLSGARAMGERWVGIRAFDELDLEDAVLEIEQEGLLAFSQAAVILPFTLADLNADTWNAATEEGDGPQVTERIQPEALTAPTVTAVEVFEDATGGATGSRLRITLSGPPRSDLEWASGWRVTGEPSWVEQSHTDITAVGVVVLETGFVTQAASLDIRGAYVTGSGRMSPWSLVFSGVNSLPQADPAADALNLWLDAIPVQPSDTRRALYYDLIADLITANVWSKLDRLWLLGAHDAAAGLVDLKARTVATGVADPDFLTSRGYASDGVDSYVETGLDPSLGGLQFTRDAAHMGVWCLTEGADSAPVCGNTQARIIPRNASDNITIRANSASSASVATASALGHTCWVRNGASSTRLFRDGVMISAGSSASAAFLAGETLRICGSDNTGGDSFSAKRLLAFHIGADLSDADVAALSSALDAYRAAVGA